MLPSQKNSSLMLKLIQFIFEKILRLHTINASESLVFQVIVRYEKKCIQLNVLPCGFSRQCLINPDNHRIKEFLLNFLTISNILRLFILTLNIPDWATLALGDVYHGYEKRRVIWLSILLFLLFIEILRQAFKKVARSDALLMFEVIHNFGFTSNNLMMDEESVRYFRWITHNLFVIWLRVGTLYQYSIVPILSFVAFQNTNITWDANTTLIFFFWLIFSCLGMGYILATIIFMCGIITVGLAYFYYRLDYLCRICHEASKRREKSMRKFRELSTKMIILLNEYEAVNRAIRVWLLYLYVGFSFAADFGFYASTIMHIDHGATDSGLAFASALSLICIAICSRVNGYILTKMKYNYRYMHSFVVKCNLSTRYAVKTHDLLTRMTKSDAAFTIGEAIHMTSKIFVVYLLENAAMVMMLIVNIR